MRLLLSTLLFMALIAPARAIDKPALENRIKKIAAKFESLQSKPDKRIPAERLRKAKGIVLMDRTKAGFIFAYQGGGGLGMLRDEKTGDWSAPTFLSANEASLGFQIGGQQSFVVILLMNTNSAQMLTEGIVSFGGEASGTAGDASDGVEATIDSKEPLVLVYTDKSGLYGGATIKGGALAPDTDANIAYYGEFLSSKEILQEKKGKPGEAARQLAARIEKYSKSEKSPE